MCEKDIETTKKLIIVVEEQDKITIANDLAKKLNVPVFKEMPNENSFLVLRYSKTKLSLVGNNEEYFGDFSRLLPRLKIENLNGELLVRACKIKNYAGIQWIVDATAGLGEDSFLLAGAGFTVTLFERDLVISSLLKDALERAKNDERLSEIVSRMKLIEGDSLVEIPKLQNSPSVILLDPMFPERRKSSLIKKKFQLLQQLERPCSDETQLLSVALNCSPQRIVIKRPLKGPFLDGKTPSFSFNGNSIRYDCIVPTQKNN